MIGSMSWVPLLLTSLVIYHSHTVRDWQWTVFIAQYRPHLSVTHWVRSPLALVRLLTTTHQGQSQIPTNNPSFSLPGHFPLLVVLSPAATSVTAWKIVSLWLACSIVFFFSFPPASQKTCFSWLVTWAWQYTASATNEPLEAGDKQYRYHDSAGIWTHVLLNPKHSILYPWHGILCPWACDLGIDWIPLLNVKFRAIKQSL